MSLSCCWFWFCSKVIFFWRMLIFVVIFLVLVFVGCWVFIWICLVVVWFFLNWISRLWMFGRSLLRVFLCIIFLVCGILVSLIVGCCLNWRVFGVLFCYWGWMVLVYWLLVVLVLLLWSICVGRLMCLSWLSFLVVLLCRYVFIVWLVICCCVSWYGLWLVLMSVCVCLLFSWKMCVWCCLCLNGNVLLMRCSFMLFVLLLNGRVWILLWLCWIIRLIVFLLSVVGCMRGVVYELLEFFWFWFCVVCFDCYCVVFCVVCFYWFGIEFYGFWFVCVCFVVEFVFCCFC